MIEYCCWLYKVSRQPQYSFGLRSMKMVTTLAGKQLQNDMAKKRLSTLSSIREDLEGDAGETYCMLLNLMVITL